MNNFTDRLRVAADYIDKHDVPRLISVSVRTDSVDFHGTTTSSRVDRLPMFLRWADTLGGDVALIAVSHGKGFHLYARGALPGTEFAAELVVIVDSAEHPALADALGDASVDGEGNIPVTREQLTKIAAGMTPAVTS
jgi:hypothetical protein